MFSATGFWLTSDQPSRSRRFTAEQHRSSEIVEIKRKDRLAAPFSKVVCLRRSGGG
jgi:hypothetical protein